MKKQLSLALQQSSVIDITELNQEALGLTSKTAYFFSDTYFVDPDTLKLYSKMRGKGLKEMTGTVAKSGKRERRYKLTTKEMCKGYYFAMVKRSDLVKAVKLYRKSTATSQSQAVPEQDKAADITVWENYAPASDYVLISKQRTVCRYFAAGYKLADAIANTFNQTSTPTDLVMINTSTMKASKVVEETVVAKHKLIEL